MTPPIAKHEHPTPSKPDPRARLVALIEAARQQIRECSPEEIINDAEAGYPWLILDVREPYEYEKLHVPGSVLVPRGVMEGALDPQGPHRVMVLCQDRTQRIAVLCDTGARSALVTLLLQDFGYERVVNIRGGIRLWEAEDLPVGSGPYSGVLP